MELRFFSKRCDISKEKIKLISHGSEIDRFYPDRKIKKKYRKKFGIRDNDIVILYTGKISERKCVHKIILATEDIQQKYNIKYLFIGGIANDFKNKFGKLIRKYQNSIILISGINNSQIAPFYQMADIGCWPSESSMSAIDALATGLPIIVSGMLTDRLKYKNGFGIKDGNDSELKKCLTELITNTKLRLEMGNRGRKLAVDELN